MCATRRVDLGPRPEPTEADREMERQATVPFGTIKQGHVIVVQPEIGTGYIKDDRTGVVYALSRAFHSSIFDVLKAGMEVEFFASRTNGVAQLQIRN
jgi:hypothetical protein